MEERDIAVTTHAQLVARRKALAKRRNVHEAKLARSAGVITLVCHDEGLWWVECDTHQERSYVSSKAVASLLRIDPTRWCESCARKK